jgi:hypothetical protein
LLFILVGCDKKVKDFAQIGLENGNAETIQVHEIKASYLAFTFLSPECPLSENYTKTLLMMGDSLKEKGVLFYYVFPGTFYPKEQIEVFANRYSLPLDRILYDNKYLLRNYCKANTTPEVFLMDTKGEIYYSGAIDNWAITLGKQRQVISDHYLGNAIQDLLEGKKVTLSTTRAVGCIIE